jgi:shikimate kinase
MAGSGKSTLGKLLAERLGCAFLDTDRYIESYYGLTLEELLAHMGLESFLRIEEHLVGMLGIRRAVIATGGSVVYGAKAVERLRLLGRVVFLKIGLPAFLARVGEGEGRGLARRSGQSLEDLFAERQPLYAAAADLVVPTDLDDPQDAAARILAWLTEGR